MSERGGLTNRKHACISFCNLRRMNTASVTAWAQEWWTKTSAFGHPYTKVMVLTGFWEKVGIRDKVRTLKKKVNKTLDKLTMNNYKTANATAKSLQSCPTLCDLIDSSPPGSPIPGILQARTLEWVATSFSNAWKWKVKVKSLSRVRLCATP